MPHGRFVSAIQTFGVVLGPRILLVKLASNYLQGYASVFVGMHRVSFSEGAWDGWWPWSRLLIGSYLPTEVQLGAR